MSPQCQRDRRRKGLSALNDAFRLLGEEKGQNNEDRMSGILQKLVEQRVIVSFHSAQKWSWMDVYRRVDFVAERNDGSFVPVQVKSSDFRAKDFVLKQGDKLTRAYGQLPVIVVVNEDNFQDESLIKNIGQSIKRWRGKFKFDHKELEYREYFDQNKYPKPHWSLQDKLLEFERKEAFLFYELKRSSAKCA
jgi:hypothetical protein